MTNDERIAALKPGHDIRLFGDELVWTSVERSGDGKTVRFFRHTPNGSEVFRTAAF